MENIDKKTLDDIANNIEEVDKTLIRLAYGELRIDDEHKILNKEGKIEEKYTQIFADAIKLRQKYPLEYDLQKTGYLTIQAIIHPIKQIKKTLYENNKNF